MGMSATVCEHDKVLDKELANALSHAFALLAALVGTPFLIVQAVQTGDVGFIVGASIFATTVLILYLASTLYHAVPVGKAKRILRVFDHAAIFLLIAGSYTPFTLGVLRGPWGWTLFGIVWGLAAVGLGMKALYGTAYPIISTSLYLLMGWLVVIAINPLYHRLPTPGMVWLVAGGVAYTAGVAFYATDSRLRYGHFIWHLFVMAGTVCHFFAILWYSA